VLWRLIDLGPVDGIYFMAYFYVMMIFYAFLKASRARYANAFPELYAKFYKFFLKGELEAARELQFQINMLRKALQRPPIAPHYEALRLRGIDAGHPRAPLRAMNEREAEALRAKLEELGIL